MGNLWRQRKRNIFGWPLTFTVYSYDEQCFYLKKGLLSQTEDTVRLYRVLDIGLKRSLLQRIFGLGTISVVSSDKSLGNFEIKNIKGSSDTKKALSDLVEVQRRANRISSREIMSDDDDDDDDESDFM